MPEVPATAAAPRSFLGDLRIVLAEPGFRKLYATRLISQSGDGIITGGIGTYVFFNATSFPNPAAAAASFAVLYLPYSLLGPFAGVFIDRWSRRQVLFVSALIRASFTALTAVLVASGTFGVPVWLSWLVVLGVNRFFLSALSAALPHVVPADELVMANSVGPTSGTIVAFIGGFIAIGLHLVTGASQVGSGITLLVGALWYLGAGFSATRMGRAQLGPDLAPGERPGPIRTEVARVAAGLWAGLRHVARRRRAAAALIATGMHRFCYGILLLMSILLYRNYFYHASSANTALKHFAPVIAAAALGYGTAAVITPIATRRMANSAWITAMLAGGALLIAALGFTFSQVEFILIAFGLGVAAQGIAICTATILQQEMEDDYRGRVFSLADMMFNTAFVAGAAASVGFMPNSGHSPVMVAVAAAGYLLAAVVYHVLTGPAEQVGRAAQAPGADDPVLSSPPSTPPSASATPTPDSRAQRSSS
jgi:MFS family permease